MDIIEKSTMISFAGAHTGALLQKLATSINIGVREEGGLLTSSKSLCPPVIIKSLIFLEYLSRNPVFSGESRYDLADFHAAAGRRGKKEGYGHVYLNGHIPLFLFMVE